MRKSKNYGMTLKLDKAGPILIPIGLREMLGFKPGTKLQIVEGLGGILLRRAELESPMVQVDGLWVHRGTVASGTRCGRNLDDVREERVQSALKV